jgi:RHS repeat-associated protein
MEKQLMFAAAKWGDFVIGVDVHMVMVPAPPSPVPVPTPMPHAFVGIVFDPLGAAISAGLSKAGGGGLVLINGRPVGNTGTDARGNGHTPTPPGVSFAPNDIPDNKGTIVTGSKTVRMGGSSAGRLTSMVMTCNYPVNLPTSVCLAVPMGPPVFIGGPDSFDVAAAITRGIRTKWFSDKVHKVFKIKPGTRLSKTICFLTGHPVDVMTGEVLADAVDFELPGPIPLRFERNYYSRSVSDGPLGPGWHHPLNVFVNETGRRVVVRLPDGRDREHKALAVGASHWDEVDRYELVRTEQGYRLTTWEGQRYDFEPMPKASVTHALVRISNRCGNEIVCRHRDGRLSEVTDSAGRQLRFVVEGGRLAAVRLRRREETRGERGEWMDLVRFAYEEGRLAAAIDPKGSAIRYAYQGGVLVKETNRNGLSFHFEYDWDDPDADCIRTWGDGGIYERRITYDKNRHMTVVDDSRGGRTHYWGNAAGLVEREMDPTGRETRYEWDEACRKVAELDGLGNRTEWAYDFWGNTVLERNALGEETRWRYSELNVPVERVDAAGNVWRSVYDKRGKLVSMTNPLGDVTRFKHDRRGNLVSIQDPQGYTLRQRYTDAGELCETTDWEGHATQYELDDRGQVVRQIDPLGGETRITRDACGLPVLVRRPDGSTVEYGYDGEGNPTEQTDALGNVTRYRHGGLNKLVERIDPAGGVVQYRYDTEDDLIGVINEAGEEYRFELDLASRVIKEHGFDGRVLEFWYDKAGRCNEVVNGQKKRMKIERDALGRVVKRVVPRKPVLGDPIPKGEVVEYNYDALGQLVRAKNDTTEVSFVRDALGRVVEERAGEHVVASRYSRSGHRVSRRTSLMHETLYDVDGNGSLLGVSFGVDPRWMEFSPASLAAGGPVRAPWKAIIKRDALGQETERRLPGGVTRRWERDRFGRPTVHRVLREQQQVSAVEYRWRSEEQLAALIDAKAGPTYFTHDERSYLVAATGPDGREQVRAPDAVGNVYRSLEHTDRSYGKGGRLQELGGARYVHDDDGQLIEKKRPDSSPWRYAWDHDGQLREVTRPDGQKVTFAYDALGRRVRKTFAGKTTTYIWDGDDLVHEVTEGTASVTWVFEPGTFAPIAKAEGEIRYGLVTDHLGAPQMLFDEAGGLAWKAQFDIYGVARTDVIKAGCSWCWPGQYEDKETGLYYNRFRYYDPEVGRYLSHDPIRLDGGIQTYAYVPDPTRWMDPLGLSKTCGNAAGGVPKLLSQFTRSTVDDVVASAGRLSPGGRITEGARAIAKKLGHAQSGGYSSVFAGLTPTQANAEAIIRSTLERTSRTFYGDRVIDVYNAAGQGVRFDRATNFFRGFLEAGRATQ